MDGMTKKLLLQFIIKKKNRLNTKLLIVGELENNLKILLKKF